MDIKKHIRNSFVSTGRLDEASKEPLLPNSGLRDYIRVIRREFPNSYEEVSNYFSNLLIENSTNLLNEPLYQKVNSLVSAEPFENSLLFEKLAYKKLLVIFKEFEKNHDIPVKNQDSGRIWSIGSDHYDIVVRFWKFGKYTGLNYIVRVFPKDEKQMHSTCLFSFVSEMLYGYGVGIWNLVYSEEELSNALEGLLKNCHCIRTALDSYHE